MKCITQLFILHLWRILIVSDMKGKKIPWKIRSNEQFGFYPRVLYNYSSIQLRVPIQSVRLRVYGDHNLFISCKQVVTKNRYFLKILQDCCRVWPPAVNTFGGKVLKLLKIVFICACFHDMEGKWLLSVKERKIRTASVHASWVTHTNVTLLSKPSYVIYFRTSF
jgi:hypothetical protein